MKKLFTKSFVLLTALFAVSAFFMSAQDALASVGLGVTQITAVNTYATADGTFAHGWSWVFDVTVPTNETVLNMKFADWISGSNNIPASNNIRFYSAQSSNAPDQSRAILINSANSWSSEMDLIPSSDLNVQLAGRQIQITIEALVPVGSAGGSYSTSYGIQSNPDTTGPVITLNGTNPQIVERATPYVELGATAFDNIDGVVVVTPDASAVNTDIIGTYQVVYSASDSVPNYSTLNRTVNVTDTIAPTATISYSTTTLTNQDVITTITPSEPIVGDLTHTFTANGSFTFNFTDLAGNAGSVTAIVENIDKTAPTLSVAGFTADKIAMLGNLLSGYNLETNNVASHEYLIQFAEGTSSDETLSDEYFGLFLKNSTVSSADLKAYYTNRGTPEPFLTYLKDAVDGVKPFAYINGNTLKLVDSARHDILGGDDTDMAVPGNYPLGTYTVEGKIKDLAGNEKTVTYILIVAGDRIAPTATISYSTTALTNQDVIATITPSEPVTVTNNEGLLTYTFTANGSFTFNMTDSAGNVGSVTATVANIDKLAPVINGTPDNMVVEATSSSGAVATYTNPTATDLVDGTDAVTCLPASGSALDLGTVTVTCNATDVAGNSATPTSFTITVQDKTAPIITLLGSAVIYSVIDADYTDAEATATDLVSGDLTPKIVIDNPVDIHTLGDYTITYNVSDSAGNSAIQVTRTVHIVTATHKITILDSAGGTISVVAINGTDQTLEITPATGYHVVDVLVDGVSVGAVTEYTFYNIVKDHTISATFAENPIIDPTLTFDANITSDGEALLGSLATKFTITTNNIAGTTHVLGLAGATATPDLADGDYEFKLLASAEQQTLLTAYFATKAGWTPEMIALINSEISGALPFLKLHAIGGSYSLVDNFKQTVGSPDTSLVIDDDYPVGTYVYTGTLTGTNTATLAVNVTLEVIRQTPVDTTPPTGTILINGGAETTDNRDVTLTLSATDDLSGVSQMAFTNGGPYSAWETYSTTKAWTLSADDGTKHVWVKFKDVAGNEMNNGAKATITLNTTANPL